MLDRSLHSLRTGSIDLVRVLWFEFLFSMSQLPDRWVCRILDLPVFDARFAQAIKRSPLGSLAFVAHHGAPLVRLLVSILCMVLTWCNYGFNLL